MQVLHFRRLRGWPGIPLSLLATTRLLNSSKENADFNCYEDKRQKQFHSFSTTNSSTCDSVNINTNVEDTEVIVVFGDGGDDGVDCVCGGDGDGVDGAGNNFLVDGQSKCHDIASISNLVIFFLFLIL